MTLPLQFLLLAPLASTWARVSWAVRAVKPGLGWPCGGCAWCCWGCLVTDGGAWLGAYTVLRSKDARSVIDARLPAAPAPAQVQRCQQISVQAQFYRLFGRALGAAHRAAPLARCNLLWRGDSGVSPGLAS